MRTIKSNAMKGWLIILSLFLVSQAFGQQMNDMGRHRGMQGNMGPMKQHHMSIPDITDEQEQKINELNLAFNKNTLQSRNDIREKEARLRTLLTQDKANQDQVNLMIDEIGKLRTGIRKERVATDLKIRDLLTDDQKVIFDMRGSRGFRDGWRRS